MKIYIICFFVFLLFVFCMENIFELDKLSDNKVFMLECIWLVLSGKYVVWLGFFEEIKDELEWFYVVRKN